MHHVFDVAVLFAHRRSHYKKMQGVDVYDEDRDALTWPGGVPVVAHPPCRGWGRLRQFSKHEQSELDLGIFAVEQVQQFGGVLEHPANSKLFPAAGLPRPGCRDSFGGLTFPLHQSWFGHRAPKLTWLYIVGADFIPELPFHLGQAGGRVENMGRAEREKTPEALAVWLVELAKYCEVV